MRSRLNRDGEERAEVLVWRKLTVVRGLEGLLKLKTRSNTGEKGSKIRRLYKHGAFDFKISGVERFWIASAPEEEWLT